MAQRVARTARAAIQSYAGCFINAQAGPSRLITTTARTDRYARASDDSSAARPFFAKDRDRARDDRGGSYGISRKTSRSGKSFGEGNRNGRGGGGGGDGGGRGGGRSRFRPSFGRPNLSVQDYEARQPITARKLLELMLPRSVGWSKYESTRDRLIAFGLSRETIIKVLGTWGKQTHAALSAARQSNSAAAPALRDLGFDPEALIKAISSNPVERYAEPIEAAFLRHFLQYACQSDRVPEDIRSRLEAILRVTDLSDLPFGSKNIDARSIVRSFHLHIGPTNSGKTYSALKSLARAKTGVYAGPLRLLAHEVWERMNLGSVGGLDGVGRACNLITGEERRVVDDAAGLTSCTVEMIPLSAPGGEALDVVVIDEIQMLGDQQRGGAWTQALLGVKAKEVHLCGDETTLELLQSLIPALGDTLEVHRYKRLTPLRVADESLGGDLQAVEPGDCIVTFSRSGIFAIKKQVEEAGGKRCAVVYGALPPETRAEQAREFNEGRAEVLVASDAVGMGLNLKIKRIIFEALYKFNGRESVALALTQVKQIAGRAGRFGQARIDAEGIAITPVPSVPDVHSGGVVTTLKDEDLPLLRELLPLSLPAIPLAVLDPPSSTLTDLAPLLPPHTTFAQLVEHASLLALAPANTIIASAGHKIPIAEIVQPFRVALTLGEMELFSLAPLNIRDERSKAIFQNIVHAYATRGVVEIDPVLESSGLVPLLKEMESLLGDLPPLPTDPDEPFPATPPVIVHALPELESLHKSLVLYIWLSFRLSLAFTDRVKAQDLKERAEVVLEGCLERLPGTGDNFRRARGHKSRNNAARLDARDKLDTLDSLANARRGGKRSPIEDGSERWTREDGKVVVRSKGGIEWTGQTTKGYSKIANVGFNPEEARRRQQGAGTSNR